MFRKKVQYKFMNLQIKRAHTMLWIQGNKRYLKKTSLFMFI